MITNYVKIFFRNLKKQKAYSSINILGLSVGFAIFILVLTLFDFNLSFDSFHKDSDRIYLLVFETVSSSGSSQKDAYSRLPLANLLTRKFSGIESATTERRYFRNVFRYQDKKFYETGVLFADTNFLKIFNYPVIAGDKESPLSRPNSVVLTESSARKYFGDENPIGKMLTADLGNNGLTVTAVIKDCPSNSTNQFDVLVSLPAGYNNDWGISGSTYTFLKLKKGVSAASLESRFPNFVNQNVPVLRDTRTSLSLLPLKDIHLRSTHMNLGFSNVRPIIQYYLILAIAIGLLVVVSVNFMILSTSRYSSRAKEVGIRKVIGAGRKQFIVQYIGESMIMALIALPLAAGIFELVRPGFTAIVGGGTELSLTKNPTVLVIVVSVALVVGLVSGIYPAFFLSSFQSASIFKKQPVKKGGLNLRKALVAFQFALTFIMITATFLLVKQLGMLSRVDLGYDRRNIVAIPCTFEMNDKFDVLEKELKRNPNIEMVADGHVLPFGGGYRKAKMRVEGTDEKSSEGIDYYPCGNNFVQILNIRIAEGRSFSKEFNDSNNVIVSRGFVRHFHLDNPIGKKIILDAGGGQKTIIGVAEDFHFPHVFFKKAPAVLCFQPSEPFYVFVKTVKSPDGGTINYIRAKWNKIAPSLPFDYFVLSNEFQDELRTSTKSIEIFEWISAVSVLIASLGLFALASFTAEKRTKEIGIRKVLGASFGTITYLLVSEFLLIVAIGDLIGLPFAYYLSNYLVNIAWVYKTDIGAPLFVAATAISVIAALSAVGVQSVKCARADPVESLRYE